MNNRQLMVGLMICALAIGATWKSLMERQLELRKEELAAHAARSNKVVAVLETRLKCEPGEARKVVLPGGGEFSCIAGTAGTAEVPGTKF